MTRSDASEPVIAVDGPAGVGKGTLSQRLATALGWHFLDSGAIYRVLGLAAVTQAIDLTDEMTLAAVARDLELSFSDGAVWWRNQNVTDAIRTEAMGAAASQASQWPQVRAALLARQRQFRQAPGLIADGRDMGTVVFPDAWAKIFLTARADVRAQRRYNQLSDKGLTVSLASLAADITARDQRDQSRPTAPLVPASDAFVLDTSFLTPDGVWQRVMAHLNSLDWPTSTPRLRPSTPT